MFHALVCWLAALRRAPEQFGGEDGRAQITPSSDMWAFACTMLCALTGRPPWPRMSVAQIAMQVPEYLLPIWNECVAFTS